MKLGTVLCLGAFGLAMQIAMAACAPAPASPPAAGATAEQGAPADPPATGTAAVQDASTPAPSPAAEDPPLVAPVAEPTPVPTGVSEPEERIPFNTSGWKTNFEKHSIDYSEIFSGGPPKDGIPAIDAPAFETTSQADEWLDAREPLLALEIGGEARAYPLQILIWHEIVNDVVAGKPVVVTYCPLCNTALVFDATRPDGQVLDFGTTGNLRFSDLVMYDRQTESWWQQITGEAIIGDLTGERLEFIPSPIVSWAEFKAAYGDGQVLSRKTGFNRPYGTNPYIGYDSGFPFLFRGPLDPRLAASERVATVFLGGAAVAFPFSVLEKEPVVHYTLGDQNMVVFYKKGTASALDEELIANSADVGATNVFHPSVEDQALTFRPQDENFVDEQTGSTWNLLGQAIAGPLEGSALEPIVSANHFWFAWAVFKPDTVVYRGESEG